MGPKDFSYHFQRGGLEPYKKVKNKNFKNKVSVEYAQFYVLRTGHLRRTISNQAKISENIFFLWFLHLIWNCDYDPYESTNKTV